VEVPDSVIIVQGTESGEPNAAADRGAARRPLTTSTMPMNFSLAATSRDSNPFGEAVGRSSTFSVDEEPQQLQLQQLAPLRNAGYEQVDPVAAAAPEMSVADDGDATNIAREAESKTNAQKSGDSESENIRPVPAVFNADYVQVDPVAAAATAYAMSVATAGWPAKAVTIWSELTDLLGKLRAGASFYIWYMLIAPKHSPHTSRWSFSY
jgi:hypothetical protein